MSQIPKTPAERLEIANDLVRRNLLAANELMALLDGMTLEEYRLSKTKLGKLLAGKSE